MELEPEEEWRSLKRDTRGLTRLVDICPNGIAMYSDNRLVQSNPALQSLLDVRSDQLLGTSLESRFASDVRESTMRKLREMLAAGMNHDASCMTRLCRSDGAEINVDASIGEVEQGGDQVVVFRPSAVFRNSSIMNREELLSVSHNHRMAVFGELAASLLHELGQPLTAANGASDILLNQIAEGKGDQQVSRQSAELVFESVTSAVRHFQRVWNFIRLRKPLIEDVDVSFVLGEALELIETAARHAGVELQFRADRTGTMPADRSLLQLAFTGILQRSLTALSSQADGAGRINVTADQPSATRLEVVIRHNGDLLTSERHASHRIPEEQIPENYGLTLSVCRKIVEENGGVLAVQPNEDSKGVCYRMIFPVETDSS